MATSPLSVWDVRVVYATTLAIRAYVPRWTSLEFSDQLSDTGSGKITLDYNDTFVDQFNTEFGFGVLFDGSHAIQILRNQTLVFTFLIEDVNVQRAGYAQETTIAGRGIAGQLEWAAVLPENYSLASEAEMGEGIQLLPRELKGYEFLARFATTANLSAVYAYNELSGTLTASANGAFPTTDGISEIGLNDTILVKDQTNTAHNGVYMITDLGSGSTKWKLERDANLAYFDDRWCYVGSRTFVQEGTANGQKAFQMDACPTSEATEPRLGTTAITFSLATTVFTAVGGFYILFKEADTGYELSMQQGSTWGDTRTEYGRGGAGNKVSWALSLDSTLNSSEGLTDSKGSTPKDGGNITLDYGKTLLDTINTVCEQTECHWHVSPTGVVSIARKPNNLYVVPFGTDRTTGSSAVMLPLPLANSSETKTSSRDLRSVVFATNSYMINSSQDKDILTTHGRRESFYSGPGNDTIAVSNTAIAGLKKAAGLTFGIDIDFVETEDRQAFLDFGLGDKVLVEYDIGSYEPRIVNGISVSIGSDMQTSVQLTFESVIPDALVKLQNQSIYGSAEGSRLKTLVSSQPRVSAASIRNAPVPSVQGMSNRVSVSWETHSSENASGYEVVVYRTSFLNRITAASRSANVATLTSADAPLLQIGDLVTVNMANATNGAYNVTNAAVTAVYAPTFIGGTFSYANNGTNGSGALVDGSLYEGGFKISSYSRSGNNTTVTTSRAHGFTIGQKIIIEGTGDTTVNDFAIPIVSVPTSTTFIYNNAGPDTSGTPAAATAKLIVEIHSTRVTARTSSAVVEGLATSGRPYLTKVISLNSNGTHSEATPAKGFFSAGGGVNGQAVDEYALQVVGGAIKSPNYLAGSTGWIIRNDGSSEFGSATVRGNITAGTISIGTSPNWFNVDSAGNIWSGGATYSVGTFKVSNTGALSATGASITGAVTATTLTATGSGTIGGWSIGSTTLTGGPLTLNSSGNISIYTASGATNYTLSLSSGGLTSKTFNVRYARFQIEPTQFRSNAYFNGYDDSTNANIQDTVLIFTNAIQLATRPISPGYTLSGGIDIGCYEQIAGQAVGNIGVYSKNSSGTLLRQINLNNGVINSYSYEGNANVAGTGNASYHPSGIYSTGTNWLYGTLILNNNNITGAGSVTASSTITSTGGGVTAYGRFDGYSSRVKTARIGDDGYIGGEGYNFLSFVTDTGIWGGTYQHHSGFRIGASLGAGGWGDGRLHFRNATNWDTFGAAYDAMTVTYGGIINAGTYLYSDIKLKEDFDDLGAVLPLLSNISIKRYNMKHIKGEPKRYGFIAQDVRENFPDVVKVEKDSNNEDLLAVDTNGILSICIKSIQELNTEIKLLKEQINGN